MKRVFTLLLISCLLLLVGCTKKDNNNNVEETTGGKRSLTMAQGVEEETYATVPWVIDRETDTTKEETENTTNQTEPIAGDDFDGVYAIDNTPDDFNDYIADFSETDIIEQPTTQLTEVEEPTTIQYITKDENIYSSCEEVISVYQDKMKDITDGAISVYSDKLSAEDIELLIGNFTVKLALTINEGQGKVADLMWKDAALKSENQNEKVEEIMKEYNDLILSLNNLYTTELKRLNDIFYPSTENE